MKTSEATELQLDLLVAKCENVEPDENNRPIWFGDGDERVNYTPSTNWAQGGPIIERERIATGFDGYDDIDLALPIWSACKYVDGVEGYGHTPLIAAMRCYVASKLGDNIDIPKELT